MSDLRTTIAAASTPAEIIGAISQLVREEDKLYRFGSFSISIYDTAWLSMVYREEDGRVSWLFPASFQYVLRSQQDDGTWTSYASHVDGILNTLASLLALLIHKEMSRIDSEYDRIDLSRRIEKAREGLDSLLQNWSVGDVMQVGSEVLVPSLLRQIRNRGIFFDFPGHHRLDDLQAKKIGSFKPEMVYTKESTTVLHSLEALVGLIDFDKVSHHCTEEVGILGSPAATAAYLLNASAWDDRAESYLRQVVLEYSNCGGVPSAFPTCMFEISWALSTLLFRVVNVGTLNASEVGILSSFFTKVLKDQHGVIGFAPGVVEDADDTARVLLTLRHLGNEVDVTPMIEKFKSSTHFRTYQVERNPSFSANCNVLLALVHSGSIEQHSTLIEHTVTFLLSQWASGKTSDKWNLSPYYSYMLLSDALLCLLEQRNEGHLQRLHKNITEHKIPICLCQVVFKTLNSQHEDGSWSHCVEETSYCIIILARCLSLPWEPDLKQGIVKSRDRAMRFISTAQIGDQESGYLWVEKVTYGSSVLRRVYYLTALGFPVEQPEWCDQIRRSFGASKCYTRSMHLLFSEMPLLKKSALHFVGLAFVEASRFAERLTEMRRIVFPRDDMPMTEDKYLSYIPIIWTICNHVGGGVLSSETLWRMILLSMLNYQVDEYMETIVPRLSTSDLNELISHIRKNCGLGSSRGHNSSLDLLPFANTINSSRKRPYDELDDQCNVFTVTESYMNFVLKHPAVISAPSVTQKELVIELYNFLIAHITQNIDNKVLKASKEPERNLNGTSEPEYSQKNYFKWVHSTAADSTSCPFSFHFFTSLICDTGRSFFDGPRAKYLGQSLTRHLATMCRQYNDCGSAARDNEETNLNSLDFPDFQEGPGRTSNGTGQVETPEQLAEEKRREVESTSLMHSNQTMKDKLIGLADFERAQMELAFKELDKAMRSSPTKVQALRVFVNVTDLFGQIYVQKDIASRVKASR